MNSRIARFCLLVAILGAPLYIWAYLEQWGLGAWPAGGLVPPHFPIQGWAGETIAGPNGPQAGGGWSVASADELRFALESFPPGTPVTLRLADGTILREALVRARGLFELLVTALSGTLFWFVAAFVFGPRAGRDAVGAFFWCSFLFGMAIMAGGMSYPIDHAVDLMARSTLHTLCLAFLPPAFLHLALRFPRRHPTLEGSPWLTRLPWILSAVICAWQLRVLFGLEPLPAAGGTLAMQTPERLSDLSLVLQVGAGLVLLIQAGRRFELTREQRQVKWLLWGMAVGVTPYVFLRTVPELLGVAPPLPVGVDRLFEMAAPIAFVIAVVRHQFLDIDIVIRRSLIYGTISLIIIATALGVAWALHRGTEAVPRDLMLLSAAVVGLGAGLAFTPLRRGVGAVVDRFFFRIERDYGRALRHLDAALDHATSREVAADALRGAIANTLHVRSLGIALLDGEGGDAGRIELIGGFPSLGCARVLLELAAEADVPLIAAPHSTSMPEIERSFPPSTEGVVVVAPLRSRTLTGILMLGLKETERRWTESDLRFVRRSAREAAPVLERFGLMRAAEEERTARERSEEMNRLKGEFLARVAHDLRTPLTSVSWSTQNLLDGVAGPVTESQADYLRTVSASTLHLQRLVDNLLEASRIEQRRGDETSEVVLLAPVAAQAVETVRAVAIEKQVKIDLRETQPLRPIAGNAHRLVQVVINLIDNAIKYSPRGGVVEVEVGMLFPGTQGLRVRDHGAGWNCEDPSALFGRFRQGKQSMHSGRMGFGLGLYIVKAFVEESGGTVRAYDAEGTGACVECRFPDSAPVRKDEHRQPGAKVT
ncbi:MAG: HAMP domain-containing histidine kinase [Candidatus Eisenbacteria bacterium]|nr:HAMP domain-containing histidine kinase [Candidatus Eisenbacteria bacterium]